jgi:Alpha/beta hydrolase domain
VRGTKRRIAGVRWIGAVVVLLVAASCVQGPVTPTDGISLATGFDLAQVGYQRAEFNLYGIAQSYGPTAPIPTDGKLQVAADPLVGAGAFKTRFVVFRPVDASKFNGTVIVEWLNVTAGQDLANDWVMAHNELIRSGYAWVGVSAQAVGVNNLKNADPARYGSLVHPGDSYSYDIFTKAGERVRDQAATVLGGLTPSHVIATGESQSASRLVTYVDAVQPIAHVYDGFMIHSRGVSGSPIRQSPLAPVTFPAPAPIRDDLDVPVMVVQAEGDVISSNLLSRQPDTDKFRLWELAGTSHADSYTVAVGFGDLFDTNGAIQMFGYMRAPQDLTCAKPINAGPHHWQLMAAFHHLDVWVRTGVAPPVGDPLEVVSTSPVVLARDAQGNALGGVRSPQVDAPVARIDGINSGGSFCALFGSTTPLTNEQLLALYPTHDDFVNAWAASLYTAIVGGYILPADGWELLYAAQQSTVPN